MYIVNKIIRSIVKDKTTHKETFDTKNVLNRWQIISKSENNKIFPTSKQPKNEKNVDKIFEDKNTNMSTTENTRLNYIAT